MIMDIKRCPVLSVAWAWSVSLGSLGALSAGGAADGFVVGINTEASLHHHHTLRLTILTAFVHCTKEMQTIDKN